MDCRAEMQPDVYEQTTRRFQAGGDWNGLIGYCGALAKAIRESILKGESDLLLQRFYVMVLNDLATAYGAVGNARKAVATAKKAARASWEAAPAPVDQHLQYTMLSRAFVQAGQIEAARQALLRSLTSLFTAQESEWLAVGLNEMSRLERTGGREDDAAVLDALAAGIRANRRSANASAVKTTNIAAPFDDVDPS